MRHCTYRSFNNVTSNKNFYCAKDHVNVSEEICRECNSGGGNIAVVGSGLSQDTFVDRRAIELLDDQPTPTPTLLFKNKVSDYDNPEILMAIMKDLAIRDPELSLTKKGPTHKENRKSKGIKKRRTRNKVSKKSRIRNR